MKEILVLVGSARIKGNTDLLADAFINGAIHAGHHVTKLNLGDKVIHGCLGCNACHDGKPCIQKDDMQEVYQALTKADIVVLASPLYFWTISAKIKSFIERLYAIAEADDNPPLGRYERYPKKDSILLMTAADELFWTFDQAVSYYQFAVVNYIGWTSRGMVLAGGCGGVHSSRCIEDTHYLQDAYQLGTNL